jgi:hypothetical protein
MTERRREGVEKEGTHNTVTHTFVDTRSEFRINSFTIGTNFNAAHTAAMHASVTLAWHRLSLPKAKRLLSNSYRIKSTKSPPCGRRKKEECRREKGEGRRKKEEGRMREMRKKSIHQ